MRALRRLFLIASLLGSAEPYAEPAVSSGLRELEVANAFVAALRKDDARAFAALGIDLNDKATWNSVSTMFERYEHIEARVLSTAAPLTIANGQRVDIEIAGSYEVLGPSSQRSDIARCWTLEWVSAAGARPFRLRAALSREDRLAAEMVGAPTADLERVLSEDPCIRDEPFLKALADRASDKFEAGLPTIEWIERISREREWPGVLAEALRMRSVVEVRTSPALARKAAQESLRIATEIHDVAAMVSGHFSIGVTHWFGGELDEAVRWFRKSLDYIDSTTDPRGVLVALYMASLLEHDRKPLRKSLQDCDELLALLERFEVPRSQLDVEFLMARLHGSLNNVEGASKFTERALHSARILGDVQAQLFALYNIAVDKMAAQDFPAARRAIDEGLGIETPGGTMGYEFIHLRARIALLEGSFDAAEQTFNLAKDAAARIGERLSEANAWSGLAQIALERGRPGLAEERATRALTLILGGPSAARLREDAPKWPVRTILAQALRKLGRVSEAERELRNAIDEIEESRLNVGEALGRSHALSGALGTYSELMDLFVDQKRYAAALEVAESTKARALRDSLAQGQVDRSRGVGGADRAKEAQLEANLVSLNREVVAAKNAADRKKSESQRAVARTELQSFRSELFLRHPQLSSLRVDDSANWETAALPVGTAAVEFAVLEHSTLAFVIRRSGTTKTVSMVRISVGRGELRALVSALADSIGRRDPGFREPASRLYALLFAPLAASLADASAIAVIPDDVLWRLPLAVVLAESDDALANKPAFRAPSLRALAVANAMTAPSPQRPSLLVVGNPRFEQQAQDHSQLGRKAPSLGDLPHAEIEARLVAQLYDEQRRSLLVREAALERSFKDAAGEYDVIHLATHGLLDDRAPMYSALAMASPHPGDADDGLLEAREIADLKLKARLVVLSACETGRGDFRAGEGLIGMSWSFLVAGVKTVVVSDWKTDSAATKELLVEFHRQLLGGRAPADAMLWAQRILRRNTRYSHPYYWAPFVVVGVGT